MNKIIINENNLRIYECKVQSTFNNTLKKPDWMLLFPNLSTELTSFQQIDLSTYTRTSSDS